MQSAGNRMKIESKKQEDNRIKLPWVTNSKRISHKNLCNGAFIRLTSKDSRLKQCFNISKVTVQLRTIKIRQGSKYESFVVLQNNRWSIYRGFHN